METVSSTSDRRVVVKRMFLLFGRLGERSRSNRNE